jgi:ParB family transcriptional regulator, chromosome partitioning protein
MSTNRRHAPVFDRDTVAPTTATSETDALEPADPPTDAPQDDEMLPTATARNNPASSIKGASQGRQDLFRMNAEALVIVTDKAHPLYDERAAMPLSEHFVASIMEHGILEPVLIRKNGPLFEVLDGRQRVRGAVEANRRFSEAGSDKVVLVPVVSRRDDDVDAAKVMIAANEIRQADTPLVRARKAQRLMNFGATLPEVARQFGITVDTLNENLRLLETAPEVQDAVEKGEVPATAASAVASLPREEQKAAMVSIRAQGLNVTRRTVKDKVKAKAEAKRTGTPEREVLQPPRKRVLTAVIDAFAADDRVLSQHLHALMAWMTTGKGAKAVPGPKGHETLAAFLKDWQKAEDN